MDYIKDASKSNHITGQHTLERVCYLKVEESESVNQLRESAKLEVMQATECTSSSKIYRPRATILSGSIGYVINDQKSPKLYYDPMGGDRPIVRSSVKIKIL
ncbi:MAG: hypothetical protein HOL58_04910 [Francisellaceae bacterium]|jgi:hypothetical protein|nr:hypothetical protein [Francisellaceae bacterium]